MIKSHGKQMLASAPMLSGSAKKGQEFPPAVGEGKMAALRLTLLGGVSVVLGDVPVSGFISNKARALLIYLIVTRQPHSREALATLLWGDSSEMLARQSLRRVLSNLNHILPAYVLITPATIVWNNDAPLWCDVLAFEAACTAADQATLCDEQRRDAGDALRAAVSLYKGDFLAGLCLRGSALFDAWLGLKRERLREQALVGLDRLSRYETGRGNVPAAIGYTQRLLALAPRHEAAHRQLIRLFAITGQHKSALTHYEQVQRMFAAERNQAPAEETLALVRELEALAARGSLTETIPHALPNPYQGLRAFEAADSPNFFGREALVQQLVARLNMTGVEGRFIALVGPSGSGKSSVVKVGLLPALRAGRVAGSQAWAPIEMIPGHQPLTALGRQLGRLSETGAPEWGPGALCAAVERVLAATGAPELLLVIDQFEELFTASEPAEAQRLLAQLFDAVINPACPLRVVVTLRADFYDLPLLEPGLSTLMRAGTELVLPLTPNALQAAIVEPAAQMGVQFEPGLVGIMMQEVGAQRASLPLVQCALTELFERREGRWLTLEAYHAIGGVLGALEYRAEALYMGLEAAEQVLVRRLFLQLVTLGEGVADSRRRVPHAALIALAPERERAAHRVEQFERSRFLTFRQDPLHGETTVEVAHEVLLRAWPRLRGWVDEGRAVLRVQRQVQLLAQAWEQHGRDERFLATGAQLAHFEAVYTAAEEGLTGEAVAFLEASLALRDRGVAAAREQQAQALRAAHHQAEGERMRAQALQAAADALRRLLWFAVALGVCTLLLVVAVGMV